jgi:hypothetical protein
MVNVAFDPLSEAPTKLTSPHLGGLGGGTGGRRQQPEHQEGAPEGSPATTEHDDLPVTPLPVPRGTASLKG